MADQLDASSSAVDPNALQYQEIVFSLAMGVVAMLGRDNPLVRYPDILWAFAAMLAFNLGYHRLLRARGGTAAPLVSMAVNVALCSLVLGLSGGAQSSFWPLYLLPIFTACLHLDRRHVLGACAAAAGFLAFFYLEAFWESREWEACEFIIKLGVLGFAAAVTSRISFKERVQRLDLAGARARVEAMDRTLAQSQKMEAVGRLAGGIAHDFNNILTAIKGYSVFLRESAKADDAMRQDAEEIEKAADRAAALTHQLLAFSRKQVLKPEILDVNETIVEIESMMRRLIREDIELVTRLESGLGRIMADPGQVSQVFMNLIVNARDAMPGGGRIVIETGDVPADDSPLGARAVMISVSDGGIGMEAETLARAFEPFFTTKEKGKGTGLGLSTVYGIVSQSGGHIAVDSALGRGTRFRIHFPRLPDGAVNAASDAPQGAGRTAGSETVLVVEDEASVRKLICRTLLEQGYEVLAAADGEAALRLLQGRPGRVDVVLTDIIMPGMSGRDLFERVAALRPETRVLYMSGYTDDETARHGVLSPGTPFLQKPFSPRALTEKIREILAPAPSRAPA
ncbi:MAG: response regulator [Elusimicrobia bacterium]|nr:response regulator [Elusimicrobiota bacterium]